MTTVLGIIADDFTGATDIAGLLARSGVPVSLRLGVPKADPATAAPFEIIALKIRTAPLDQAVSEALQAHDWLKRAGAARFFWKYCSTFDSTDQGNIGPVAEALMQATGADQTIYCPAFPENGRAVFMGQLFVGQDLLDQSPMKDHPLTPMRDSSLMRLLQPQVAQPVGLCDRLTVARGPDAVQAALAQRRDDGVAHVIVDAVADEDLSIIAEACRDMPLITGGSALAMPLPALYQRDGYLTSGDIGAALPSVDPGAVILSGSCSQMTRAQVAAYQGTGAPCYQLDPFALAETGPDPALAWLVAQDISRAPLIYATAEPDAVRRAQDALGHARAGELVEDSLSACALAARDAGARRFVVAGGETSGAVSKALGVDRLIIGPEIAPGVPWTFGTSKGHEIALALKSGNFGSTGFFAEALARLEPA